MEPTIIRSRGRFWLACRVEKQIEAPREAVWAILTDAEADPAWNSTIVRIDGTIRPGHRLALHVPGTSRVFTPLVNGWVDGSQMTWSGGVAPLFTGVRRFALQALGPSLTHFAMEERFSGLMLPLVGGRLPDFGPLFARFATDLRYQAVREQTIGAT